MIYATFKLNKSDTNKKYQKLISDVFYDIICHKGGVYLCRAPETFRGAYISNEFLINHFSGMNAKITISRTSKDDIFKLNTVYTNELKSND